MGVTPQFNTSFRRLQMEATWTAVLDFEMQAHYQKHFSRRCWRPRQHE